MDNFLTTAECAARHGVTQAAILSAISRGAIPACKFGPNYVIHRKDCDAYKPAVSLSERGKRNLGLKKTPRKKTPTTGGEGE